MRKLFNWLLPSGEYLVNHKVGFIFRGAFSALLQALAIVTLLVSVELHGAAKVAQVDTMSFILMITLLILSIFWMLALIYRLHQYRWGSPFGKGHTQIWCVGTYIGFFVLSVALLAGMTRFLSNHSALISYTSIGINIFEISYIVWLLLFAPANNATIKTEGNTNHV